jgi:hypothetical protein
VYTDVISCVCGRSGTVRVGPGICCLWRYAVSYMLEVTVVAPQGRSEEGVKGCVVVSGGNYPPVALAYRKPFSPCCHAWVGFVRFRSEGKTFVREYFDWRWRLVESLVRPVRIRLRKGKASSLLGPL